MAFMIESLEEKKNNPPPLPPQRFGIDPVIYFALFLGALRTICRI